MKKFRKLKMLVAFGERTKPLDPSQGFTPGVNNLMVNSMDLLETDLFIGSFGKGIARAF